MYEIEKIKNKIIHGDVLKELEKIPGESIDCIITSPPYYGLRDYGVTGQIGLEKTLDGYLQKMLAVTKELKRVLKKEGTLWLNHGDSYAGGGGGNYGYGLSSLQGGSHPTNKKNRKEYLESNGVLAKCMELQNYRLVIRMIDEQGWILRNTIIWHKPNCMPSSVKDRFTVDYEPLFFFSKSKKYFFEPQYEPYAPASDVRYRQALRAGRSYAAKEPYKNNTPYSHIKKQDLTGNPTYTGFNARWKEKQYKRGQGSVVSRGNDADGLLVGGHNPEGRNKRSVWRIPTQPFPEAHFATFPEALIETPIKAGCPEFICTKCGVARQKVYSSQGNWNERKEKYGAIGGAMQSGSGQQVGKGWSHDVTPTREYKGLSDCGCGAPFRAGVVLDCFFGSGTVGLVALKLNRNFIGIELNEKYIKIAEDRLRPFRNKLFN